MRGWTRKMSFERSSFPSHTHPLILQPTPPTTRRSDGPLRRSHLSLRSTPNRHTHFLVLPLIRTHLYTRTPRTCLSTLPERGMMDIDACGRAEAALGGCRKYATSRSESHLHRAQGMFMFLLRLHRGQEWHRFLEWPDNEDQDRSMAHG